MSTLVIYGVLQEKIMRVPYGANKEYFKFSLFLVFCNHNTTSVVSAVVLASKRRWILLLSHKYYLISRSNILDHNHNTCLLRALKYVAFPARTLANASGGTVIMQKKYKGMDYLIAFLVTLGCSIFILSSVIMVISGTDVTLYSRGRENTIWGVSLMLGYLRFDGFTSTFQDKLFKAYDMEIQTHIFYTTICSWYQYTLITFYLKLNKGVKNPFKATTYSNPIKTEQRSLTPIQSTKMAKIASKQNTHKSDT
ncbi:hypothetical protein K2173_004896 [Erythroxylum novogranatense]|uniref:Uncharacterized protein n=1 Tax=Erythroxylum novogranatense TaxID=1862640 RepID=A0AAV8U8H8_9ROSI|nr:hypothetical protein K2173_004896 [Erythroxylum novogranatense]